MPTLTPQQQVIETACSLNSRGLSVGNSGNVSIRHGDGFLITPSGVPYGSLREEDIVYLSMQGERAPNALLPSSEWHFHRDIYLQRPDAQAIVHAHPTHCTALACTGRNIPAFHYMVAVAGGSEIPLAPYALFGSQELSSAIIQTLGKELKACLMAHHGLVALEQSLPKALALAEEVEALAQQYCQALAIGGVKRLTKPHMDAVLERFKSYGKQPTQSPPEG